MGQFVEAAARFPTVSFTSALVVALGFWLLVLLGHARVRDFDADAPYLARSFGGVPVAVAVSVVIATTWLLSLTGMVLMGPAHLSGLGGAAARVALLGLSVLVAWTATRRCAVSLAGLFPGHAGPHLRHTASATPYDPGSRRAHS
ncbi:hypothetical protein [Streptomyces sp. NBC_00459]|uniref:hypothetical protein n=1 Tax=Streptomyces sp. NBC_00459 TaxID=2975749 RepID=UPI002E175848